MLELELNLLPSVLDSVFICDRVLQGTISSPGVMRFYAEFGFDVFLFISSSLIAEMKSYGFRQLAIDSLIQNLDADTQGVVHCQVFRR
jgi:hypothetical protein